MMKDTKLYVKPHSIKISNQVVFLKFHAYKSKPPYGPDPFEVIDVRDQQITAERYGKNITRDAQKQKNFKGRTKPCYSSKFISGEMEEEDDICAIGGDSSGALYQVETQTLSSDAKITHFSETTPPSDLRRSTRERRLATWFKDYQTGT